MKERIVWILIAVMAVAFLYLKVKQTVGEPAQNFTASAAPRVSAEARKENLGGLIDVDSVAVDEVASASEPPLNLPLQKGEKDRTVRIGDVEITVEIADTDAARSQGLSGRESLPENQGMLFIMDQPGIQHFWMKDMRFPLDIIWIRDGRVVDISENVPAPAEGEAPMVVSPREAVDQVLEVNAGFAKAYGVVVRSSVIRE